MDDDNDLARDLDDRPVQINLNFLDHTKVKRSSVVDGPGPSQISNDEADKSSHSSRMFERAHNIDSI